jgi:hypothetical protein
VSTDRHVPSPGDFIMKCGTCSWLFWESNVWASLLTELRKCSPWELIPVQKDCVIFWASDILVCRLVYYAGINCMWSQWILDSSVRVRRLQALQPENGVTIPGRALGFYFLYSVGTNSEHRLASYQMVPRGCFSGRKAAGTWNRLLTFV